jgi:DNA-binding GntR family transcriptional regulator
MREVDGAADLDGMSEAGPDAAREPGLALKPDQVAERVRTMILDDRLPPGSPIRERALAAELRVSRTPLREALQKLAAEGLVELHPNRGARVAAPSAEELHDLLQLLAVLEGFAGELAAERATEREIAEIRALHYEMLAAYTRGDRLGYFRHNQAIHQAIVHASRNQALIEQHRGLNARLYRARYVCNQESGALDLPIREHEHILELLARRDGAALSPLLREHVFRVWHRLRELEQAKAPPAPGRPSTGE